MNQKIQKLLKMLLLNVDDISSFQKDFNSIIDMFNKVSKFKPSNIKEVTLQKKISYKMLREDVPDNTNQIKKQQGKYFIVPQVINKK